MVLVISDSWYAHGTYPNDIPFFVKIITYTVINVRLKYPFYKLTNCKIKQ